MQSQVLHAEIQRRANRESRPAGAHRAGQPQLRKGPPGSSTSMSCDGNLASQDHPKEPPLSSMMKRVISGTRRSPSIARALSNPTAKNPTTLKPVTNLLEWEITSWRTRILTRRRINAIDLSANVKSSPGETAVPYLIQSLALDALSRRCGNSPILEIT